MDNTSPEHDRLVALAVQYRRLGNLAGLAAMFAALRETDGERFTIDTASPTCTLIIDRWRDDGQIVDTHDVPYGARTIANRMNTRNIRDGQQHLRGLLAAATAELTAAGPRPM